MSALLRAASRLFRPSGPPRRLTFGEALAIANAVAQAQGRQLGMVQATTTDGRPTWTVSTSGVGQGWFLVVDDATAAPGPLVERPGR